MFDTIFALSTPPGRGGVGVVRVSGSDARRTLSTFGISDLRPRYATRSLLRDLDGNPIDDGLTLYFPGPASFTGEDVVELHIHSGPAIVHAVLTQLSDLPGYRMADPGEFTRRAFENGKLDLTEAEGLADLIDAETEGQRIQALRQLQGGLGDLYGGWQDRLVDILAMIEAGLDFSDEEDVLDEAVAVNRRSIEAVLAEVDTHLQDGRRGELVRDGVRVAIVGRPNVGKSSLLNALVKRDAAIVSDIAGTTRDRVDVQLDLGGFATVVSDTAGIRDTTDVIELEGIRRARAAADDADLVVRLGDCSHPEDLDALYPHAPNVLDVWNKSDLSDEDSNIGLKISAQTGEGLAAFEKVLERQVSKLCIGLETPSISRMRHREMVAETSEALRLSLAVTDPVLVAEELRRAVFFLGKVVGKVDVEDVLDRIFSAFCIGK